MTSSSARRSFRSPWRLLSFASAGAFVLVGASMIAFGDLSAVVIGIIVGAPAAVIAVRAVLSAVLADGAGLLSRPTLGRRRLIGWSEITRLDLVRDRGGYWPAVVPTVVMRDEEPIGLTELSFYSFRGGVPGRVVELGRVIDERCGPA